MPLIERVLTTVRKHDLIRPRARVLAAVSGGADSVALALVLARLAPELGFALAGIAHLNHGLRGNESDRDEAFAASLAERLKVPFVTRREDVGALAAEAGESIETAARRVRYACLNEAAAGLEASCIATGHTADDQAETILMRLMRGAGLQGLSAIRPRNGNVIRPLLDARRAEVEAFLTDEGQGWRDDGSNADRSIARNRIRHEVMPAVKAAGGDGVVDAIARTASLIQDDAEELDRQAIEIARGAVLTVDTGAMLDVAALEEAGPALARRVIRRSLMAAAGARELSLEHVEAVRSLIRKAPSSRVQVPGLTIERWAAHIRIWPRTGLAPLAESVLAVPGAVELPMGLTLSAEVGAVSADELAAARMHDASVAVQGVEASRLTVRSRRPGDALRPLGGPGRRKLQDVFVDRKVARAERDQVPLVLDDRGRIIWVVGHTIADEFRVTAPEGRVLLLKVRRSVGGSV